MTDTGRLIRRLVTIAVLTAILETAKFALNAIANVELITLLIILFTRKFGGRITMASVFLFTLLETMWWGLSIWTITYFYVWPLLVFLTILFRNRESLLFWSIFSAFYGLFFGALCALTTLITAGANAALAWWIAGIPYDIVHCVSNFIICMILFLPLSKALEHIQIP